MRAALGGRPREAAECHSRARKANRGAGAIILDVTRTARLCVSLSLAGALGQGCREAPAAVAPTPVVRTPTAPYSPGLGELMSLNQMRHVKLWFAGEGGNWKLAAYELDELKEGLDDVARYHPEHKDSPVPIGEAVEKIMTEPLAEVGRAVEKRDRAGFVRAYDALTDGCNRCHQATNFGFNVVQRPTSNPYSNQVFAPPR